MNSVERRELRKVVQLDFETIENRIRLMASREVQRRKDEIDESQAERRRQAQEILDNINVRIERLTEAREEAVESLQALDFDVSNDDYWTKKASLGETADKLKDKVATDLKKTEREEVSQMEQEAIYQLHKKRNSLLRNIAVSALESDEAQTLLDDIPQPQELLGFEVPELEEGT